MIKRSFHKIFGDLNFEMPDDKMNNCITIRKGKIYNLTYKNIDGVICNSAENKEFEIKRLSGCIMFNCKIELEYNTQCYNRTDKLKGCIKLFPWEYLTIKYYQKKLWINQRDFQQKVFLSVSSAIIGAIASLVICKIFN